MDDKVMSQLDVELAHAGDATVGHRHTLQVQPTAAPGSGAEGHREITA